MATDAPIKKSPAVAADTSSNNGHLYILIIGAGLCGLGAAISLRLAGHSVVVLESVQALQEVGAGLQLTPNGTRILRAWGVDKLLSGATSPANFSMYRYDGRRLAKRDGYGSELEKRHGNPSWCIHRADLQSALVQRARDLGAVIRLNAKVRDIDSEKCTVTLHTGETIHGDFVFASDGLWSTCRSAIFDPSTDKLPKPLPTGDLAYRIMVNRDQVADLEVAKYFQTPSINIWVGPGMHAVAYSVRGGSLINLVLLVPDNLPAHAAKAEGDLAEMRAMFEGWDPLLTKVLEQTDKVLKWRLHYLPPLPRWTTSSGRCVIAGDCAHPMLPYMAQGANSSLEDAATIGALLSHVTDPAQLPAALAMYDAVRRPRVDRLVRETFLQGENHHLADGEKQEQRDEKLGRSMLEEYGPESNTPWTHPEIQPWIYGYDAYAVADAAFQDNPF